MDGDDMAVLPRLGRRRNQRKEEAKAESDDTKAERKNGRSVGRGVVNGDGKRKKGAGNGTLANRCRDPCWEEVLMFADDCRSLGK